MNFSLRQLRAFLSVARYASFTKAAEQMHITQAGLSATVRELEQQLRCRLFERTTRAVRLTAAGISLLPVAKRVLQELEDVANAMGAFAELTDKRLRVGVTPLIASSVMPEVLQKLRERKPDVHIDVLDADRALIQESVEHGDLDVGLGAFFTQISGIQRESLFAAQLVLASSLAQPIQTASHVWGALDAGSLISLPSKNPIQRLVDSQLEPTQEQLSERRVVTHLQTVLAMVEAGLGYAVVPSFAALANTRWRVRLSAIKPVVPFDYYSIVRAGRPLSESVLEFLDAFKTVANVRMSNL